MSTDDALATLLAASIGILLVVLVIIIAWAIFYYIGAWKMYKKAGKEGWMAIIPFYNDYVLCEIVGLNWYWFVLMLVPTILSIFGVEGGLSTLGTLVGLIADINVFYNLSKKFNKGTGWFVLSIFFGAITLPILGYSSSDKFTDVKTPENGILDNLFNSKNEQSNAAQQNVNGQQNNVTQPAQANMEQNNVVQSMPSDVQQSVDNTSVNNQNNNVNGQ